MEMPTEFAQGSSLVVSILADADHRTDPILPFSLGRATSVGDLWASSVCRPRPVLPRQTAPTTPCPSPSLAACSSAVATAVAEPHIGLCARSRSWHRSRN